MAILLNVDGKVDGEVKMIRLVASGYLLARLGEVAISMASSNMPMPDGHWCCMCS